MMAQVAARAAARDQTIHIRANQHQRTLIDQAAKVLGKNRSEFILEAACRKAEEVILDRTFFFLDEEAFDQFEKMLDNPPAPTGRLRELLQRKAPWE